MMFKMLVDLISTVEILVIPPFLAAVWIEASWLKNNTPKKPVAVAVPTLDPTSLEVASTGRVRLQEDNAIINAAPATNSSFFMIIVDLFPQRKQTKAAIKKNLKLITDVLIPFINVSLLAPCL